MTTRATGWDGFDGYVVDDNSSIAVKAGDAELLTEDQAKDAFGVKGATSAFCVHVPPGSERWIADRWNKLPRSGLMSLNGFNSCCVYPVAYERCMGTKESWHNKWQKKISPKEPKP